MRNVYLLLLSILCVTTTFADESNPYDAAVASESRLAADAERDAGRKPADVMAFFGIESGMQVLDLFSGGGYYTELLAHVVGESGAVVAHSNEAYLGFVGEEFEKRHADGRLPNVTVHMAENNAWNLPDARFDFVMMALSFHDLFLINDNWPEIDIDLFLESLHQTLKVGGTVGIIDHAAIEGAPASTGSTLHRIDRALVIDLMTAAGFELIGVGDHLHNPDDSRDRSAFDPELRGKTDRFILQFKKL